MATTIDRRKFLGLSATAAGAALGCGRAEEPAASESTPTAMRYRPLGDTGLEVSEIAFGAHGVDNPPLMAAALEAGITTFCTSGRYMDGGEEKALGEAMARIGVARDRVVILTGNPPPTRPDDTVDSITAEIDASLGRLRTDHIDIYCNAMVESTDDVLVEPLFEAFERAKQAGKVGHLAIAGHHGGMQELLEAGIECGRYGVFFTKYDFVSYPEQDEILNRAAAQGIGTMVFKVGAGNRKHEIEDLEAGGLSFHQATLKWALGQREVASVAVTFTNFDHIRESTAAVGAGLAAAETAMLRRYADEMRNRYCRFCTTCEAGCPHGVSVAEIMRYEMYFSCYGRKTEATGLYRQLPDSAKAAACLNCDGSCESACPFHREIRAGLLEAHEIFDRRRV
jgi:aryl-alcohol dehydrogenase-like predicted oxidoreductase